VTKGEANSPITVDLGGRSYDVLIGGGLIDRAGDLIAPLLSRPRVFVVSDRTVAGLYLPALGAAFERAGIALESHLVAAGEASKSFAVLEQVINAILAAGGERDDTLIALGGGVVGDLAGLAASLVRRGMKLIQMPTTLLAQVDSAIGGKTAINTPLGKNLAGSFHQPALVLADISVLASLPPRQRRAAYGEIAKCALLAGSEFVDWLEESGGAIIDGDAAATAGAVARCCRLKAKIVSRDEREAGCRALLNLGHTFAHAFEAEAGFDGRLVHGEAVAAGLVMALDLSARLGHCPPPLGKWLGGHFDSLGIDWRLDGLIGAGAIDSLIGHMAQDKKRRAGSTPFVLCRGAGDAFLCHEVPAAALRETLTGILA